MCRNICASSHRRPWRFAVQQSISRNKSVIIQRFRTLWQTCALSFSLKKINLRDLTCFSHVPPVFSVIHTSACRKVRTMVSHGRPDQELWSQVVEQRVTDGRHTLNKGSKWLKACYLEAGNHEEDSLAFGSLELKKIVWVFKNIFSCS